MSVNVPNPHDSIGESLVDHLARSFTVGVDADGGRHHYYRPADTVVVYTEGGVEHRERLEGATLDAWVDHVEDVRGWASMGPHSQLGLARDRRRKEGER